MYPRTNYEMTEEDLARILDACKPTPVMMIGGTTSRSPQQNANAAWAELGKRMGFDSDTVKPISGKGNRFFSAVPSETEDQRAERIAKEEEAKRAEEIRRLTSEIEERQERIKELAT